jgi:hypothetical protein
VVPPAVVVAEGGKVAFRNLTGHDITGEFLEDLRVNRRKFDLDANSTNRQLVRVDGPKGSHEYSVRVSTAGVQARGFSRPMMIVDSPSREGAPRVQSNSRNQCCTIERLVRTPDAGSCARTMKSRLPGMGS